MKPSSDLRISAKDPQISEAPSPKGPRVTTERAIRRVIKWLKPEGTCREVTYQGLLYSFWAPAEELALSLSA